MQDWFKNNFDGVWEHGEAIQIKTLDTSGWEVEIDITSISGEYVY
ncbi:immunity 53 family protein [Maribacter vaceletii]|nr:immunity 53 family protein [Maribacter vaceletii]